MMLGLLRAFSPARDRLRGRVADWMATSWLGMAWSNCNRTLPPQPAAAVSIHGKRQTIGPQGIGQSTMSEKKCHLPRDLALFSQNDEAFRIVDAIRWPVSKYCPRCNSLYTKPVNTAVFRELVRCVDCGYMFNTFSGTLFQGAKIPVVKFFQLFTIHDALDRGASPRDLSYAIDVSNKTAVSLIGRLADVPETEKFAHIDKEMADSLKGRSSNQGYDEKYDSFFLYCDMKNIVVDIEAFRRYLAVVLSARVHVESTAAADQR